MTQEQRLTRVYRAASPVEASFLKGLLREEGIPVRTFGPKGSADSSDSPGAGEIEIHVPEELADAARKALDDYEARAAGEANQEPWLCARCAEENEAFLDACWNCNANRR